METVKYRRKPFIVEVSEITEENIHEAAGLLGGSVMANENGVKFIEYGNPKAKNKRKAYIGFYITSMNGKYRCYSPNIFASTFDLVSSEIVDI